MDIKSLQCFLAVAEQLNFGRAAKSLYLSQPSLSIRISNLETELGVTLFDRTHQRVFLTDAGAALLPKVREIIEMIHSLRYVANNIDHSNDMPKKLTIGVDISEDRNLPILGNVFSRFMQCYPEIELKVQNLSVDEYEHKLLLNEMDFCIMVLQDSMPINPLFLTIPLLSEPMVMVTANADGQSIGELIRTREVQLLFEGEHGLRWNEQYLSYLRKFVPNITPTYIENASLLCMNLFLSKIITFFPRSFAESIKNDQLMIVPLDIPHSEITLTLLWNKMNINPAIQLMANEFRSEISSATS